MSKNKDIKKVISKESKVIAAKYASKRADDLTIKLTDRELKMSLRYNYSEHKPTAKFSNDFVAQLSSFVEYNAEDAENIEVEFDPKSNQIYIDQFKKAWSDFFALKIYREDLDIKELRRKNTVSIIFGILCLLVVIAFGVTAVFYTSKPFQVAAVCIDAIFSILSWVLIWEFFYDVIYTMPHMKRKQISLYKMYKAKMEKRADK